MSNRMTAPQSARARSTSQQHAELHSSSILASDASAPAVAPLIEPEQTDADKLARLLQQYDGGEGFTARLERVQKAGTPAELCGYLGTIPFSDDFLDDVRAEHGGGKYRARVYDASNAYRVSFSFSIAGAARRPGEGTAAPVGVGPASAESSRLEKMLAELAGAVAGMAAAMQKAPRTEDELDRFVTIARALKEINPPAAAPAAAGDGLSTLETFFRLQDMLDERAPRSGGTDNIGRIVEHGVKPIASLLGRSLDLQERAMQRRQEQNVGARRIAAPVAVTPASTPAPAAGDVQFDVPLSGTEQTEHAGAADAIAQLADTIPGLARSYLANQAKNDRDPETYAVMALDTISESAPDTYAQLPELLQRADFTAALLDAIPQWSMYPEWFGELVEQMRAQLADVDDVDDAPAAGVEHQESAA